jgi:MinD superfamily P-loop ATPase
VVINRCDLGDDGVENYCQRNQLSVLQKIPFDLEMAKLYARGEPAVIHLPAWQDQFVNLFERIMKAHEGAL